MPALGFRNIGVHFKGYQRGKSDELTILVILSNLPAIIYLQSPQIAHVFDPDFTAAFRGEEQDEMNVLTQLYLELNPIIFFKIPSRSNKMIDDVTYSKFSA